MAVFMRVGFIVGLLVALTLTAAVVSDSHRGVDAQDATPGSAQSATPQAGVTELSLGSGVVAVLAPGTATLDFGRINLPPGASYRFDPSARAAVLMVEGTG